MPLHCSGIQSTHMQRSMVIECKRTERVGSLIPASQQGCSGLPQGFFALKKTRASGRNVGKVFNPVVKLVLENQPFLMPEPAEKPSLQCKRTLHICDTVKPV